MIHSKRLAIFATLIITCGVAWLLNTLDVLPPADWLWVLGLLVVGILIPAAGGLNKATFVAGPLCIVAAITILLRQLDLVTWSLALPWLVIASGLLLLLAAILPLPVPDWLTDDDLQ